MSQLKELSKPFPDRLIEQKPGNRGGKYVTHSVVTEYLLKIVGPFDFELVEVVRGRAPEIATKSTTYPAREDAVVGVVARLTATIDGTPHRVEEVGTEDNPAMNTDAANLKNAMSDALKRCAMRFGLGLHLWSQEMYALDNALGADTVGVESAAKIQDVIKQAKAGKPLEFAKGVLGREVASLADLPIEDGRAIYRAAKDMLKNGQATA